MKLKKSHIFLLVFVAFLWYPANLLAETGEASGGKINWFLVISTLLGGLSLFLYGIEEMSESLKRTAGNRMRKILAALSKNRFVGLFVGAFVTMVIQSSGATTAMLVSFVNSGLMDFSRTLGIILGANIGTTITAQIIAFKITDYAILIIVLGFAVRVFAKTQTVKDLGNSILGFGLLFYGMFLMSEAMKPLRTYEPMLNLLKSLKNPLIGVLVGMIFTAIIQSSSAFTGIIILLAQQNLIGLEEGIILILGANIGTCITAILASLNGNRAAKRVAIAHVTFKVLGVLLFIFWVPQFTELIQYSSQILGAGKGREIANAHTFFNVITAFLFLPFTNLAAKVITKIYPDKPVDSELIPTVRHLDENVLKHPALAIDLARAEIGNVIKLTRRMLRDVLIPFLTDKIPNDESYKNLSLLEAMAVREKKIDFLEAKITDYLVKITQNQLNPKQSNEVFALITVVNYLETIGDIIIDDILSLIKVKQELATDFSEEGKKDLQEYHLKLIKQLSRLEEYFSTRDIEKAKKIIEKWERYKKLDQEYRIKHYIRMNKDEKSLATHKLHMELMDHFQQIGFHIDNIAKAILRIETAEYDFKK